MKTHVVALLAVLSLSIGGCKQGDGQNIKIDGVDGPHVNFVDNKLTMTVVLQNVAIDGGIRLPVPHMPNSYLEVGPDFQSNGYLISVAVDAKDVKALTGDAFNVLDPLTLPGGRPLPGVVAGQLPGMAIQVPALENLVFYVGNTVFGVFVPVKLPKDFQGYMVPFRFYDSAGDQVGNIALVGPDAQNKNSGFLLLINLKGKVGQLIKM